MPDLHFHVQGAAPKPYATSPLLVLALAVTNTTVAESIHAVMLQCQIQIEATRRRYGARDQEQLLDLFGTPERWGQTLRSMLWTHTSTVVPPFIGSTVVELPVPCTFDFNVAATKYFAALKDGEVPLNLQFSGTIFYATDTGGSHVAQIPWDKEARYRLPVQVWQVMMEVYYPNSAWLCLRRDVFEQLHQYKRRHGLLTFEQALEHLLPAGEEHPLL